ncbi:hypothetical protein BH11ARM2_BH11ARM2_13670 [soil metagenome]
MFLTIFLGTVIGEKMEFCVGEDERRDGRPKLRHLFAFLEALHAQTDPLVTNVDRHPFALWLDRLPQHPALGVLEEDSVLRVQRIEPTPPPPVPEELDGWIANPLIAHAAPALVPTKPDTPAFADNPLRVDALERLRLSWQEWAPVAKVEEEVNQLYGALFNERAVLERDSERYEMVFGDGLLEWGEVRHPVLLRRLEIVFDAANREICLTVSDRPVEAYLDPILNEGNASFVAKVLRQVEENVELDPLNREVATPFLQGLVQELDVKGTFGDGPIDPAVPRIRLAPVVFRRIRRVGTGASIREVLEDLEKEEAEDPTWWESAPEGLLRILGIETRKSEIGEPKEPSGSYPEDDERAYFTKPANAEQYRIVRRLEESGAVLVQGPPGTGKTHTIANLIGHLLAEGKSVLVTSHTSKALNVLRDKVVEPLRPLCVSVLESDRANRAQLEEAISGITNRVHADVGEGLFSENSLRESRQAAMKEVVASREALRRARASEYDPIVLDGESIAPEEAGRQIAGGRGTLDWIPGELVADAPLPLSPEELRFLYATNRDLTPQEEANSPDRAVDLTGFPAPAAFQSSVEDVEAGRRADLSIPPALFAPSVVPTEANVDAAESRVEDALAHLAGDVWKRGIVDDAARGHSDLWRDLANEAEQLSAYAKSSASHLLRLAPVWEEGIDKAEAVKACSEIEAFLRNGGSLSFFTLLAHGDWKRVQASLRVGGETPKTADQFAVGREILQLERRRAELVRVWDGLMAPIHGPLLRDEAAPESTARSFVPDIRACVVWQEEYADQAEEAVAACGLVYAAAVQSVPVPASSTAELDRNIAAFREIVLPALRKLGGRLRLEALERTLASWMAKGRVLHAEHPSVPLVGELLNALESRDPVRYASAYAALDAVGGKHGLVARRRELLARLAALAPGWAARIRDREPGFDGYDAPQNAALAWRWLRLDREVRRRAEVSVGDLSARLTRARERVQVLTADLVEKMAWGRVTDRMTLKTRQSLAGYLQLNKKIGKGTGKRAPRLMAEARKAMIECQSAVPVWIMPLSRVTESFDLRRTRFDVLIVDEASQLDVYGLLAMYIAKEIVIVGDHEQVSPLAVGQNLDGVDALIDAFLEGVPNNRLYDGRQSVYALAQQSFDAIGLREHFRCVAPIIAYSNGLSYRGEIIPLRESANVRTRPFVVPYRVGGATYANYTNEVEAQTLVALLKACLEQPEYAGLTFGAINLLGDNEGPQVRRILSLALTHIGETELEARRFRCGNSAQFQGDERDVMFLSLVDGPSPKEGPLSLRAFGANDLFKQRYNVAASRARDQMWVLHSMDPETDLKVGDIRRGLIEFARDPEAAARQYEEKKGRTESEFERRVLERLCRAGYRVTPQYKVGAFRLDFVVEGDEGRAALECDGEAFHTLTDLPADMERQATLERLGWRFVRLRGSEFFRDEETSMSRVFADLQSLRITPNPVQSQARDEDTELLDRIKRRAGIWLSEWRGEENSEN